MNGYARILEKTERMDVISGTEFSIDTKGLDCILKPSDTDIWVCARSGAKANERFVVKAGESFEFCGKIYLFASMMGSVSYCLYKTL